MAAPFARLRAELSAPGLLTTLRQCFDAIADHRTQKRPDISLSDALMSGLAVFGLKYPSLLQFDEDRRKKRICHNLSKLYGVEQAPCDTQLRDIIDPVDPTQLHPAFRAIHTSLQRGKALEKYGYLDGHYLVSIDGTGHFASNSIHCPECCVKELKSGDQYYHQLLGAVMVHPDLKTVLPFAPEAMTRQDGSSKNDCERNACKRLLTRMRKDFPHLKLIVVEDSLASNGPHVKLLKELDMRFILGVKEGDHAALFETIQAKLCLGQCTEFETTDAKGTLHGYRFLNHVALNKTHPDLRVNFLEYWSTPLKGKPLLFSWITDIELNIDHVEFIMKGGRARWKIENETFNTLKNQGYFLEHNYGHGKQHLATNLALLMMLAFLIDQTQELCCRLFQAARANFRARYSLWERLRAAFFTYYLIDWGTLWEVIATESWERLSLTPDTT
jgi:hypothetical protein